MKYGHTFFCMLKNMFPITEYGMNSIHSQGHTEGTGYISEYGKKFLEMDFKLLSIFFIMILI